MILHEQEKERRMALKLQDQFSILRVGSKLYTQITHNTL